MTPELRLRDAVLDRLRATPAVSDVVGEKVYDDVPADGEPDLPWIFAGPLNATRLEVGGLPAWDLRLRIFIESAAFDRDQAWSLARAAMRAVEGFEPAEVGFCDRLSVRQAGDVISPLTIKAVFFDVVGLALDI
ncbi:DUF3168 domain-containing protein [Methylobacterium currus]|uniref:DUF3168 domain-containing protein n=1 Tax=Methylobacterium currus TaxID=2051553 RepID=UPI001E4A74EE|nr:DUF3168 domain-containing protein [Methylobacterium currus]UHC14426.1 DUF3168 domain-containing protein [Methylobacterium currus]